MANGHGGRREGAGRPTVGDRLKACGYADVVAEGLAYDVFPIWIAALNRILSNPKHPKHFEAVMRFTEIYRDATRRPDGQAFLPGFGPDHPFVEAFRRSQEADAGVVTPVRQ